jgi:hypothetical protein
VNFAALNGATIAKIGVFLAETDREVRFLCKDAVLSLSFAVICAYPGDKIDGVAIPSGAHPI